MPIILYGFVITLKNHDFNSPRNLTIDLSKIRIHNAIKHNIKNYMIKIMFWIFIKRII